MAKQSAGILLYRLVGGRLEVLLVHPGGPFFARKEKGCWSVPKGEFGEDEAVLDAAKREFSEELGTNSPDGEFIDLGSVKNKSGKTIYVFAAAGDFDPANLTSNKFDLEWPPKSGQIEQFPEVDKATWFDTSKAKIKINSAQAELIDRLASKLAIDMPPDLPQQSSLF